MSWKFFVTAGVLGLLAAPAFAADNAAPTLTISPGGTFANNYLNAAGNWVWKVQVTPDFSIAPVDTLGTPVATELGFTSTSTGTATTGGTIQGTLINAARLNPSSNFDTLNPGNPIFTWQTNANGMFDSTSNNKPTGIQTQCVSGNCSNETRPGNTDPNGSIASAGDQQVFAALGSLKFTAVGARDFITIEILGPRVGLTGNQLTNSTITTSGAYTTGATPALGGLTGLIAQLDGGTSPNFTVDSDGGFVNAITYQIRGGDTNMNGVVDAATDYNTWLANTGVGAPTWYNGDFNGDGVIDAATDYNIWLNNTGLPPSGLVAGGAIPEPASVALIGLATLTLCGLRIRRR